VTSDQFKGRLSMMTRDISVYGRILASQRLADLAGEDPTFMAQLR